MTSQYAAYLLIGLVVVSVWITIRFMNPEIGLETKTKKAAKALKVLRFHHACAVTALAAACFIPNLWGGVTVVIAHCIIQNIRIARKQVRLIDEIDQIHQGDSVMSLKLGTTDHTSHGTPLKLWFKRGTETWPPIELEVGAGIYALPINEAPAQMLSKLILPRIAHALTQQESLEIFCEMRKDLAEVGVNHPIDIKGWNHNPIISAMIEKIMEAKSPDEKEAVVT